MSKKCLVTNKDIQKDILATHQKAQVIKTQRTIEAMLGTNTAMGKGWFGLILVER